MRKFAVVLILFFLSLVSAHAGPWSTLCVFQTDNTCTFNLQPQTGLVPGFGIANLFVPVSALSGSTTLTIKLSHDNVTYYAPYSTNTTAYDVYTGDNTTNKAYGMYLDGAYYMRVTASDNTFNGATLYLQGRY